MVFASLTLPVSTWTCRSLSPYSGISRSSHYCSSSRLHTSRSILNSPSYPFYNQPPSASKQSSVVSNTTTDQAATMAGNNSQDPNTPTPAPHRRRSSIADLFQSRNPSTLNTNTGTSAFPSMQARQNNTRRMSVSTSLGLSGSPPTQTSPFGTSYGKHRDSISSSQDSGSPNQEEAIFEDNEGPNPNNTPVSPFARRVSFGAQAFGSVRTGGGSFSNGEGFNWGDSIRERPLHVPTTHQHNAGPKSPPNPAPPTQHQRAASIAAMEPPKQMPQPSPHPTTPHYAKPDVLGERMLRGDFTMD